MIQLLYHIKHLLKRYYDIDNIDRCLEKIAVKYYKLFPTLKMGISHRCTKRKIIISLTTIPNRIDKVWITIESLLRQTYKPDQIILWLAQDEFANMELPDSLRQQMNRGLTIKYCDNLRSYKKFYYTAMENPYAYIVTADDDVIYAEGMLKNLIRAYKENPHCIICIRSHQVRVRNGKLLPYDKWIKYEKRKQIPKEATFQNFAVGCGGTLFPMFLMDKRLFEKDVFTKIAPTADDVWLNMIAWISGIKTKNVPGIFGEMISVRSSANKGLYRENRKKNDEQIERVLQYLEININDYL